MDMKRVGSFNITDEVVYRNPEQLDAVAKLMGEVFICSATHNFGYGRFEYIGFSELFDTVDAGYMAPSYQMHLRKCNTGGYVAYFGEANE